MFKVSISSFKASIEQRLLTAAQRASQPVQDGMVAKGAAARS